MTLLEEIDAAIKDMEFSRKSHTQWATYFEAHPDIEAQYVATGEWNSAAEHREIEKRYTRVIDLLTKFHNFKNFR